MKKLFQVLYNDISIQSKLREENEMSSPITRVRLRRKFNWIRFAGLTLPPIALFFWLGRAIGAQGTKSFDDAVAEGIRLWSHPAADGAARLFDAIGSTAGFASASALIAVLFAVFGRGREALLTIAAAAGAWAFNTLAKNGYERARPAAEALYPAEGFSFPSGSGTIAIALFGFAAIALIAGTRRPAFRMAAAVAAVVLIGLMGVTRVYAGLHYPTDIIGGYLLGFAWMMVPVSFLRDR